MNRPTQKQLDYILGLAWETGQPRPELPTTALKAGAMIAYYESLKPMREKVWYHNGQPIGDYKAFVAKVRPDIFGHFNSFGEGLVSELRSEYPELPLAMTRRIVYIIGEAGKIHL